MTERKKLGLIYSIAFVIMLALNYWTANDVGMIARQDQVIIQPASYVFSIWGLIYILLLFWLIRLFVVDDEKEVVYDKLSYWPVANFILNGMWIIAFTQEWKLASVIIITALLITLIVIYLKITKYRTHWFDRVPFSVYFAWGTVATIVNIVDWVNDMEIEEVLGLNEYQWTLILLVIATGIALLVSLVRMDWIYPLVFVWTYVGIIIENENQLFLLTIICAMGIVFQVLGSTIVLFERIRRRSA
ncbi:MAG: tryptophan-rich sensory protein [Alkalibacterium sp.]|nr:tryptophan-rich sensory protein [Alkalibacterium sp.]TVP91835.1 MAG: tryptophan-rich sensory protein [Alkalibacterium sp.]